MTGPPQTLGRYRLISLIGAGGMGKVYRAHDAALERDVAIKVLPAEVITDPSRVARFIQEARAASALNHPHVVTVYDIGEERIDGQEHPARYIAMELLDGKTLRELTASGPMELHRQGLALALDYMVGMYLDDPREHVSTPADPLRNRTRSR